MQLNYMMRCLLKAGLSASISGVILIAAQGLSACAVTASPLAADIPEQGTATKTPTPRNSSSVLPSLGASTQSAEDSSTIAPTADPNANKLVIWWPASLYPEGSARQVIMAQFTRYEALYQTALTVRIKRSEGSGGIFETLRSGIVAAPSTMPDLTLMRRSDLVQAAASKLIEPLDLTPLQAEDFFTSGLALGKVNGIQYGVPYTLQVDHMLYRTSAVPNPPQTFDAVLKDGEPFLFAGGTTKGVNTTLLAQYIAAGGQVVDENNVPTLNVDAFRTVLHYYEQYAAAKVSAPQLLDFTTVSQYWPLLTGNKANFIEVDSTTYLAERESLNGISFSQIPMPDQDVVTSVNGWMWVITTANPERQAAAFALLQWYLADEQQSVVTKTLGILPSRKQSLDAWGSDDYTRFVSDLLSLPTVPPADMVDANLAGAMQQAFADVLSARKSAESAALDAAAKLGGNQTSP
jgi:ABC-type glycerol-3-phosphate transport system substrate-binding protein